MLGLGVLIRPLPRLGLTRRGDGVLTIVASAALVLLAAQVASRDTPPPPTPKRQEPRRTEPSRLDETRGDLKRHGGGETRPRPVAPRKQGLPPRKGPMTETCEDLC